MKKALSILILVIIFINILPINTIIAAKEEKIVPSEICNAIANELSNGSRGCCVHHRGCENSL